MLNDYVGLLTDYPDGSSSPISVPSSAEKDKRTRVSNFIRRAPDLFDLEAEEADSDDSDQMASLEKEGDEGDEGDDEGEEEEEEEEEEDDEEEEDEDRYESSFIDDSFAV